MPGLSTSTFDDLTVTLSTPLPSSKSSAVTPFNGSKFLSPSWTTMFPALIVGAAFTKTLTVLSVVAPSLSVTS